MNISLDRRPVRLQSRELQHCHNQHVENWLSVNIEAVTQRKKKSVVTRKRKTVHLLLSFLWIEASHKKPQDEGVWVIKQAKQLSGDITLDKRRTKQTHK